MLVVGAETSRGRLLIRAFVVLADGGPTLEELHHWCRLHLADHKQPRRIVCLDAIPRTERNPGMVM